MCVSWWAHHHKVHKEPCSLTVWWNIQASSRLCSVQKALCALYEVVVCEVPSHPSSSLTAALSRPHIDTVIRNKGQAHAQIHKHMELNKSIFIFTLQQLRQGPNKHLPTSCCLVSTWPLYQTLPCLHGGMSRWLKRCPNYCIFEGGICTWLCNMCNHSDLGRMVMLTSDKAMNLSIFNHCYVCTCAVGTIWLESFMLTRRNGLQVQARMSKH